MRNVEQELGLDKAVEIDAQDVSYGYEEGHNIIQSFSQKFEQGKTYGLVAASGAGKTTLFNLLTGLLQP